MKLTIIIPVYNEFATIVQVIERLQHAGCEAFEWIFVDDGSNDGSTQLLLDHAAQARIQLHVEIMFV